MSLTHHEHVIEQLLTDCERDATRLRAINAELVELAQAFVDYLVDNSRSERRKEACLTEARALLAKARGES